MQRLQLSGGGGGARKKETERGRDSGIASKSTVIILFLILGSVPGSDGLPSGGGGWVVE